MEFTAAEDTLSTGKVLPKLIKKKNSFHAIAFGSQTYIFIQERHTLTKISIRKLY